MPIISETQRKQPSNLYGLGIFVDTVRVVNVEPITCDNLPKYLQRTPDLGVRITYDIGKDWQPTMDVFGDFKESGSLISWGGAYKVRDFFEKLGVSMKNFDTDKGITGEMLQSVIGKEFKRLAYVKGVRADDPTKNSYADWNEIGSADESPEALVARFQKSVRKGFPSNYRPDLVKGADTALVAVSGGTVPEPWGNTDEEVF